jgi:predicted RNase H-like HicB family nuclease
MITEYIQAATRLATYELLPEDEGFYAEIPALPGVWANAPTLEECREELIDSIETWIVVKLRHNDTDFPVLDGLDFNPRPVEQEIA